MKPAELAIVVALLVASVASLSWIMLRRARWASPGLGLELKPPSERTDPREFLAGLLFIGSLVVAGLLGGPPTVGLALAVQIVGTGLIVLVVALLRPAMFGRPGEIAQDADAEDASAAVANAKEYDVFVSYRSQDVHTAREVADRLIASGISVWFAEYQILLVGRDRFQDAILDGIRRSRFGLAITNDRYVASAYCRLEMEELLERRGPPQILEARFPAEEGTLRAFPRLGESPHIDAVSTEDILSFLESETGWRIEPGVRLEEGDGRHIQGRCPAGPYVLDATGWDVVERGGESVGGDTIKGPVLRYAGGRHPIFVNLYAGRESAPQARRQDRTADDREMYDELLAYLPHHVGRLGADVRGVHLLFHGGLSQMAVTYRLAGYWTRKHSVILPHPATGDPTEFVFTFGFFGPYREYCRHAHLMDRLVTTLQWAV